MLRTTISVASAIVIAAISSGYVAADTRSAKPVSVEIWTGGDDGLTQRFAVLLKSEFASTPGFAVSEGSDPANMQITIATHLWWDHESKGKTKVKAIIYVTGKYKEPLGATVVSCSEDDLTPCAEQTAKYVATLAAE